MRVRNPTYVIAPILVLTVAIISICGTVFRNYFLAFGWHLRHGNHTSIRGSRVHVPLLWWREDYDGGNIGLVRAVPRSPFLNGRTLMWYEEDGSLEWWPIAEERRVHTGEEAIRAIHDEEAHPTFSEPKYAEVVRLLSLHREGRSLYCWSEETHDSTAFSTLSCRMAGAPVEFRYSGSPLFEKDAERILSEMQ